MKFQLLVLVILLIITLRVTYSIDHLESRIECLLPFVFVVKIV